MIYLMFKITGRRLKSDPEYPKIRQHFDQTYDIMKDQEYWQIISDVEEESDSSPEEENRPATRHQTAKAD